MLLFEYAQLHVVFRQCILSAEASRVCLPFSVSYVGHYFIEGGKLEAWELSRIVHFGTQ